jgi:aspartate-semialdehyde dehydrogenase
MSKASLSAKKKFNVAVVGATGAVGIEMVRMLEKRKFPVNQLRLFASQRSAGKKMRFNGKPIQVERLDSKQFSGIDVALFSAGGSISLEYAPMFAEKGIFVIDNSSAWRMDPDIPLVVPEVNPEVISEDSKIIANPNCSTIQMVVALKPLHDAAKIKAVRVATYQSVSGAGGKGIQDLEEQSRSWAMKKKIPAPKKIPHQIAFNLVPQIDVFTDNGYTKEEMKMVNETQKIMGSDGISVSATCVRVPVFRSHSESVWIETERPLSVEEAQKLLRKAPGVKLVDDPKNGQYPMPLHAEGEMITLVGRIRKDLVSPNGLILWVVSDNLLKGAALNAVEIAELLVKKGIL